MYRIIIAGDRYWSDDELKSKIMHLLLQMPKTSDGKWNVEIIHGACEGVDMTADCIARKLGFIVKSFPANWYKYGRAGGPVRNSEMLDQQPDIVYLFHKNLDKSRGTRDIKKQAEKRGIPVVHFS